MVIKTIEELLTSYIVNWWTHLDQHERSNGVGLEDIAELLQLQIFQKPSMFSGVPRDSGIVHQQVEACIPHHCLHLVYHTRQRVIVHHVCPQPQCE